MAEQQGSTKHRWAADVGRWHARTLCGLLVYQRFLETQGDADCPKCLAEQAIIDETADSLIALDEAQRKDLALEAAKTEVHTLLAKWRRENVSWSGGLS